MTSDFLFWAGHVPVHVAQLSGLEGFADDFEINEGISHAGDFSPDAYYGMVPDFPDDTLLADQLCNISSHTVVSQRVQTFLAAQKLVALELLKARVLNHRKRDVGEPYYIVHPVGTVACLDRAACNIISEDEFGIDKLEKVAIVADRVPPDRLIFRIENLSRYVCVRRELAQAIDQQNFIGIRWVEPEEMGNGLRLPADLTSLPPRAS